MYLQALLTLVHVWGSSSTIIWYLEYSTMKGNCIESIWINIENSMFFVVRHKYAVIHYPPLVIISVTPLRGYAAIIIL